MKLLRTLGLALSLSASLALRAAPSAEPILPPALPWQGNSLDLLTRTDDPLITPAEKNDLTDTPSYDETIAYLRLLADRSPFIRLVVFGHTAQGRDLYVAVASKEGTADAATLCLNGRRTLLAQAGIHAGEIDGKDAGLMLLRDIAAGRKAALLDRANFMFIPVFNADGHERSSEYSRPNQRGPVHQGWRTTAQNLNLNRDYVKADAPEMRALLALLQAWEPSLYLDLHVTDGIDYQYDITFGYNGYGHLFAWSPAVGTWLDEVLAPAIDRALVARGHIPGPLISAVNSRDLAKGIEFGVYSPRFSTGYGDLCHVPSVLVENHALKPYRQRVLGTYVLLEAALQTLGERGPELTAAIAADRARRPKKLEINWDDKDTKTIDFNLKGIAYEEYLSPISGINEVRWLGTPKNYRVKVQFDKSRLTLIRPMAYYVPATKPQVIERLRLHGIRLETLIEARTVSVQLCRLVDTKMAAEPYEGHHLVTVSGVKWETHDEVYPAGSVRVSTDQPLGDLAMTLLEPQCSDSLLAWGFFPEIFQRTEYIEGYVVAKAGELMLAHDPELKTEFEQKLAGDEKFAKDPAARLRWFYERSPFYDQRYLLYPVGIER